MNKVKSKIKQYCSFIRGFFPEALPTGVTAFNAWADSFAVAYPDVPNNDSLRWTLAFMIMHLGSTTAYKAKVYFYLSVKKSMANQIASSVVQELKQKQAQEQAKQPIIAVTSDKDTSLAVPVNH